jgi:hypothetical protein
MQRQPQEEETEANYLRWVDDAAGNISRAARDHASTERDIEPLRKRVQGAGEKNHMKFSFKFRIFNR